MWDAEYDSADEAEREFIGGHWSLELIEIEELAWAKANGVNWCENCERWERKAVKCWTTDHYC